MPVLPIRVAGQYGVIKDLRPSLLPPNAWTDARNMRGFQGGMEAVLPDTEPFGAASVAPTFILPVDSLQTLYLSTTQAYAMAAGVHTEVTPVAGPYADSGLKWQGDVLSGIGVVTNGAIVPQMWSPPDPSTKLADLTAWPVNTSCRVIRAFKNHLVSAHITKPGGIFPNMVKWSHPADPGSVPTSWDETDPTKDAGERDLGDGVGQILDMLVLGDALAIYMDEGLWFMRYQGGQFIFNTQKLFSRIGVLATGCVSEFDRKHAVLTDEDFIIFDGVTPTPVMHEKWRRWLFRNIDTQYFGNSFVATNMSLNEIGIFFPEQGSQYPSKALLWNWREDSWGIRELDSVAHAVYGPIALAQGDWDSDTGQWNNDSEFWGLGQKNSWGFMLGETASPKIVLAEEEEEDSSLTASESCFLERTDFAYLADGQGQAVVDLDSIKFVRKLVPHVKGTVQLQVYVGSQDVAGGEVTWHGPFLYDTRYDTKIECGVSGRLLAFKFEVLAQANMPWFRFEGFDLDIIPLAAY